MRSEPYNDDPQYDLVKRYHLDAAEDRISSLEAQVQTLKDEVASLDRTLRDLDAAHR